MAGESVDAIAYSPHTGIDTNHPLVWQVERIIREGARGTFDAVPMKQARVYARATGVKIGRMVEL